MSKTNLLTKLTLGISIIMLFPVPDAMIIQALEIVAKAVASGTQPLRP